MGIQCDHNLHNHEDYNVISSLSEKHRWKMYYGGHHIKPGFEAKVRGF